MLPYLKVTNMFSYEKGTKNILAGLFSSSARFNIILLIIPVSRQ